MKLTVKSMVELPDSVKEFKTGAAGTALAELIPVATPATTRAADVTNVSALRAKTFDRFRELNTFLNDIY